MARGWLIPNSLYRVPFFYLFLACVFCYCSFFLSFLFCFVMFFLLSLDVELCRLDGLLIFFCPADHVPDWQPRILLGMVEARSIDVKKTTTTATRSRSVLIFL